MLKGFRIYFAGNHRLKDIESTRRAAQPIHPTRAVIAELPSLWFLLMPFDLGFHKTGPAEGEVHRVHVHPQFFGKKDHKSLQFFS